MELKKLYNMYTVELLNESKFAKPVILNWFKQQMLNSFQGTELTKEQIEQRGYRSIDELLNDLPAIQILNHADSGIMNQIGIRGIMGNNYFKILQDGIEINQTDGEIRLN